jgi:hypothetical protein
MGYKYPADQWVTRFIKRQQWQRILAERAAKHDEGISGGLGDGDMLQLLQDKAMKHSLDRSYKMDNVAEFVANSVVNIDEDAGKEGFEMTH